MIVTRHFSGLWEQPEHQHQGFTLHVDHVQGDPFAEPSKVRLRVPQAVAHLPEPLRAGAVRRLALEDLLARRCRDTLRSSRRGPRGSGKSGLVTIDAEGNRSLPTHEARIRVR